MTSDRVTRHPLVTAIAVGIAIFVLAVCPCLYLARLVDGALRATPRPTRRNYRPRSIP